MADFHLKGFDDATKVKLDIFRGYIREWLGVFMTRPSYANENYMAKLSIFDFFSGPGYDSNKNPGSPIIITDEISSYCKSREDFRAAIQCDLFFNDSTRAILQALNKILDQLPVVSPAANIIILLNSFVRYFRNVCRFLKIVILQSLL
jgi:three-Cys-motif partner protein